MNIESCADAQTVKVLLRLGPSRKVQIFLKKKDGGGPRKICTT